MRGAAALSRHGGPGVQEDPDRPPPPLPLRATGIVLSLWVFVLVILAVGVVPLLFATCFPGSQSAP